MRGVIRNAAKAAFTLCLCLVVTSGQCVPAGSGEPVVVMTAGASPLSTDQIAQLYLGRSNALKALDPPETNTLRDEFFRKATERDAAQIKAIWSRIIFTGQGQPPKQLAGTAAVKRANAGDPQMVGYIDKSDDDATVKIVLSLH